MSRHWLVKARCLWYPFGKNIEQRSCDSTWSNHRHHTSQSNGSSGQGYLCPMKLEKCNLSSLQVMLKKIISFVTSHFSIYAVVYKEAQTTTTTSASTSTTTGATTGADTTTTSAVTNQRQVLHRHQLKHQVPPPPQPRKKGNCQVTGEQISMVLIGVGIVGFW